MKYFPPTELALNSKGEVYHLGLLPEQLAEKIILVGDQDRVALVSSFFEHIEFTSRHREFVCQTGLYKPIDHSFQIHRILTEYRQFELVALIGDLEGHRIRN